MAALCPMFYTTHLAFSGHLQDIPKYDHASLCADLPSPTGGVYPRGSAAINVSWRMQPLACGRIHDLLLERGRPLIIKTSVRFNRDSHKTEEQAISSMPRAR